MVTQSSGGELTTIGRRGGGGRRLRGRGVAVSSGGGHGDEGGSGEWSEWPVRAVALDSGRRRWPARAEEIKRVVVVDDVAAQGRQLMAGGAVARSKRRLCSEDRGVVVKEQSGVASLGGYRGKRRNDVSHGPTTRRRLHARRVEETWRRRTSSWRGRPTAPTRVAVVI
jgi:hypothetical protein